MNTPVIDKITKAKTKMVFEQPFFAFVALKLEFIEATWCPTMATDGRYIYYSPAFVEKLTVKECAAVIAHEVMHVAWLHMLRRGNRDPLIWNFACDYAINPTIMDAGFTLPGGDMKGLFDEKYRNWTAYAIYEDLMKNVKQIKLQFKMPSPDGSGQGQDDQGGDAMNGGKGDGDGKQTIWGAVLDATGADGKALSDSEKAELEEEIKITIKSAAEAAKSRGKLPAGMEGLIDAIGKPKINWKDYIQSWVSGKIPDNYTWTRPNRKMMSNYGIYMPRMQLNGAGIGVLSVDTSGSVSNDELREYVREIAGVIEICNPEKLYIIQHDAIIQRVDEWEAGEDFSSLKIKGRGGTCIQPSFKYAAEKIDDQIDWMICFTDMGIVDYPQLKDAPDFPVLWAATGPDNAPFGTYLPLRDAI